jgi:hypothetical protein
MINQNKGERWVAAGPEAELLLYCAQSSIGFQVHYRVEKLLRGGIDWDRLLRMAGTHAVIPLLHSCLYQIDSELIPKCIIEQIQRRALNNVRRNLTLTGELFKLMALFEQRRIAALPFKGPVMAALAYDSIGLRSFGDLDILVRQQDIGRTVEALTSFGYMLDSPMGWAQKEKNIQFNPEVAFVSQNGAVHVDLHWGLTPSYYPFGLDPECFWGRSQSVEIDGRVVSTLSTEDLLLFLCAHGAKHLWERLGWICDVARLVNKMGIDWDRLLLYADEQDCELVLLLGLCLARKVLGVSLPAVITHREAANKSVSALVPQLIERLFLGGPSPPTALESRRFIVQLAKDFPSRMRFCFGLLLVPTEAEWAVLRLPPALFAFYYPLRLWRLGVKYALRPLIRIMVRREHGVNTA